MMKFIVGIQGQKYMYSIEIWNTNTTSVTYSCARIIAHLTSKESSICSNCYGEIEIPLYIKLRLKTLNKSVRSFGRN